MDKKNNGDLSDGRHTPPTICTVLKWNKNKKKYPLYDLDLHHNVYENTFPFIDEPFEKEEKNENENK